MIWVKSSYSNTDGGACVEWAPAAVSTTVPVRDSKDPERSFNGVSPASWKAFVDFAAADSRI